jgi:uncharacterized protein YndB with AHSA1/START domain
MKYVGNLKLTLPTDREVELTRDFDAPRTLVYDAMTKPELIKRWLTGPPGWTMAVCEVDLKVGGKYRYVWNGPNGVVMGMGGVWREIVRPERLVATERFDESWYPGEAIDTTVLVEQAGKTKVTITVQYESREARDAVLKTPMAEGMAAGYENLAQLLATMLAGKVK